MKKILITRRLLRSCEEKASKIFNTKLNINDELYSQKKLLELSQGCDGILTSITDTIDRETINKESAEAQKALMEKAKAEEMDREDLKEALTQLIADRNSKIEILFNDKQVEIIKIYTALGMQYSKHCGQKGDGKDNRGDGGGKK